MAGDSWHPGGAAPAPIRDDEARHGVTTLRDFLRIAWRRKVILIICVLVTPLAAGFVSVRKPDTFEASAKVLLKRTDIASSVGKVTDPTLATDPERDSLTQAIVARDPKILSATAKELGTHGSRCDRRSARSVGRRDGGRHRHPAVRRQWRGSRRHRRRGQRLREPVHGVPIAARHARDQADARRRERAVEESPRHGGQPGHPRVAAGPARPVGGDARASSAPARRW